MSFWWFVAGWLLAPRGGDKADSGEETRTSTSHPYSGGGGDTSTSDWI